MIIKHLFHGQITWEAIQNLKKEGYDFNCIAEMDMLTLAHKRDMTKDFYLKHKMPAYEWKQNAMINSDKTLLKPFPQNWWHPIISKFDWYQNNKV